MTGGYPPSFFDRIYRGNRMKEFEKECEELHRHLLKKLDHKWQLETWKDKYKARLRKYGLDKCKRAIDGFCYPGNNWYVQNLSNRAPELIFRSNKALETFLAKAPEIQENDSQEKQENVERSADFRKKLEKENKELTARFHKKIRNSRLKEDINSLRWHCWIKPLLVVGMKDGVVVLFHEQPSWVQEHYAGKISDVIGKPVKMVNQTES